MRPDTSLISPEDQPQCRHHTQNQRRAIMTQNKTMHIIFGTGPVGQSVMAALLKRGQPVRMVSRSGSFHAPAGVEVVAADAYQASVVQQMTQDAQVVYQ